MMEMSNWMPAVGAAAGCNNVDAVVLGFRLRRPRHPSRRCSWGFGFGARTSRRRASALRVNSLLLLGAPISFLSLLWATGAANAGVTIKRRGWRVWVAGTQGPNDSFACAKITFSGSSPARWRWERAMCTDPLAHAIVKFVAFAHLTTRPAECVSFAHRRVASLVSILSASPHYYNTSF